LDFANFLPLWSILAVFWPKNAKKGQNRENFFEFSFVDKHLHTKFHSISSNGLEFANFFHLWPI